MSLIHDSNKSKWPIYVSAVAILTLVLSWMVFPYYFQGEQLLSQTGQEIKLDKLERSRSVSQLLSRRFITPTREELTATFATEDYFKFANSIGGSSDMQPDKYHIFFITESIHTGSLPSTLPEVALLLPDDTNFEPVYIDGPKNVEHHRTTFVYFDKFDLQGNNILPEDDSAFRLVMKNKFDNKHEYVGWFEWNNPPQLPDNVKNKELFSPTAVILLSIGLLSAVLTPCMLQLSIMYLAVLCGSGSSIKSEQVRTGMLDRSVKRKVQLFALAFIAGFVLLFSAVGALIGWSGQLTQAYFSLYSTQVSIAAGIMVLGFGTYLAYQAKMPLICKLPLSGLSRNIERHSILSSAVLAIGYSLGCITCFGGAIIGTLMIYVGALQSPVLGATIMGLFAVGIGLPFILAAFVMSKSQNLMTFLMKWQHPVRYVTASVVMFFGLVLVTDNYHTLSDFIYPYLGLG